jgi:predicted ATPase
MNLDVNIKNLGKIEQGTIRIRPITVLTGPNGTGKSFFTKYLYSILNVINKNVYYLSLTKKIKVIKLQLESLISNLSYAGDYDYKSIHYILTELNDLQIELDFAADWKVEQYLEFAKSRLERLDNIIDLFNKYLSTIQSKKTKYKSASKISKSINESLDILKSALQESNDKYIDALSENLENEVKDNFQISNLSELVTFGNKKTEIDVPEMFNIVSGKDGIGFSLKSAFVNEVSSFSRVVFFESPAYWKVREALKAAKSNAMTPFFLRKKSNNILTGVPKYFYDLDEALGTESRESDSPEINELTSLIKNKLGGEFLFKGDSLIFKDDKSGKEISKNLISFGMTNLGMIHTLLKNNVITPGSVVFFDEPETNLHPDWQVLLMDIFIQLAEYDIKIVIATHSIDMLKALEVGVDSRNIEDDEFMSIHYLDTDGKLLDFDSTTPSEQLKEARSELNSSYTSLFFKE